MLPKIKNHRVNWQDGMKISKNHFIQMENSMIEQVRDMTATYLTNNNYGLLGSLPHLTHSLDIRLYADKSEHIRIVLSACRAITPGGLRIEITADTMPAECTISKEKLKASLYEIYVCINPYERIPFGNPDPSESPLRQPFASMQYHLEVLPYPQTHAAEYGIYHLCIGRLEVVGESIKLSEHFIPSCIFITSLPRLQACHLKLLSQLGETEISLAGIIQKINAKDQKATLDNSLLLLCNKSSDFLNYSLDNFRQIVIHQTPVHLVNFFCSYARTLNSVLNSMIRTHREELLEYFHRWFELAPREFENLIRSMLVVRYDHSDIYASLQKVEMFSNGISSLFKKFSELNFLQKPIEDVKIYGWLIVHTENRRAQICCIKSRVITIGRHEKEFEEVDFSIDADSWVSRRHAKITIKEERGEFVFYLTDLNSNNGTYIHDTQTRLKSDEDFVLIDSDTFQVGNTNIVFKSSTTIATEDQLIKSVKTMDVLSTINFGELIEN